MTKIELPEEIEVDEPYGWQLQVMDIIKEEPDERTIHWFWEPKGGVGKSSLVKYLWHKHKATVIAGKGSDILKAMLKVNEPKIVLFDIPRANSKYIPISALESIKNGLIVSGRHGGAKVFNPPHVIVFASIPPKLEDMSSDRWNVVEVGLVASGRSTISNR